MTSQFPFSLDVDIFIIFIISLDVDSFSILVT